MINFARTTVFSLAVVALVGGGCNRPATRPASAVPVAAVQPFEHRFTINVGGQPVRMRVAVQKYEQERGLMQVAEMPEDEGMIFVYDHTQQMSFWMRNVTLPLDIGFFDAGGILREAHAMYPHVEDPVKSVTATIQFALEMNQGWFARHGVKPGATIDLAALRAALRERGFDPEKFIKSGK